MSYGNASYDSRNDGSYNMRRWPQSASRNYRMSF